MQSDTKPRRRKNTTSEAVQIARDNMSPRSQKAMDELIDSALAQQTTVTGSPTRRDDPKGLHKKKSPFSLVRLLLITCLILMYRYFSGKPYQTWSCRFMLTCRHPPVHGFVKGDYLEMKTIFERNLAVGEDVGAAFAAYVNGEKVIELQGGYFDKDRTVEYSDKTLQMLFSTSKAVTSIAMTYLVDRGILDFDDKVTKYWPEFGQNGKENVTLQDVLTHRGGLPFIVPQPSINDTVTLSKLGSQLAAMPHYFNGESKLAYHAITRGWILNEIVRRAHPLKWTLGRIIREEIGNKTGIEYHLGMHPDYYHRVSPLIGMPLPWIAFHVTVPALLQSEPPADSFFDALFKPWSLAHKALIASGPALDKLWPEGYNNHVLWGTEAPSYSGFSNANSVSRYGLSNNELAHLAAFMANNGSLDNTPFLSKSTHARAHRVTPKELDPVTSRTLQFCTAGWGVLEHLVEGQTWYGWAGAGGSLMVWNLEYNLAFSYVMNAVRFGGLGDRRSRALLKEFVRVVKEHHQLKHT